MSETCSVSGRVKSSIPTKALLESDKLDDKAKALIAETDADDKGTVGKLTQEEMNLAAIKIKQQAPSQFDAYLDVLAKQSACVNMKYIDTLTPAKAPISERGLPKIELARIILTDDSYPSQSANNGKVVYGTVHVYQWLTIDVRPFSPGSGTSEEARFYIYLRFGTSISDRRAGKDGYNDDDLGAGRVKELYITGAGKSRVPSSRIIDDALIRPVTNNAHFDISEAREMLKLLQRSEVVVREHSKDAEFDSRIQTVISFIEQRIASAEEKK